MDIGSVANPTAATAAATTTTKGPPNTGGDRYRGFLHFQIKKSQKCFLFQVFSTQRVEFFRGMRHEVEDDDYSSDFLDDLCYGGDFMDEGDYWLDQR